MAQRHHNARSGVACPGTSKEPNDCGAVARRVGKSSTAKAERFREGNIGLVQAWTIDRACRLLAALELSERVRVPREARRSSNPCRCAQVRARHGSLEQEQMRGLARHEKQGHSNYDVNKDQFPHDVIRVVTDESRGARNDFMIVVHSHPSGEPTPSPEDVAVTQEIVKAAKALDIECLDHIVIGEPADSFAQKKRDSCLTTRRLK